MCPSCGNLRSVCSDPTRDWYPYREVCRATAARELTWRRLGAKYPPLDDKNASIPHPLDGVGVGMLLDDPDPDEKFFD